MELVLWRHAEAEDGTPDSARPLTTKGRKQADQMARWLRERLPEGCTLLASPAVRAQQTAAALKIHINTSAKLGLQASSTDVLAAAGWPDAAGTVVIVGHQPTLGEVASRLLTGRDAGWSVKKGAVWWFSARPRGGALQVVLRAVMSPDLA
jgi:phosphohistidine phosphatase